jgi:hypothetical protein
MLNLYNDASISMRHLLTKEVTSVASDKCPEGFKEAAESFKV